MLSWVKWREISLLHAKSTIFSLNLIKTIVLFVLPQAVRLFVKIRHKRKITYIMHILIKKEKNI